MANPSASVSVSMPSSVLFVCGENALRSPMAEAIMKHLCGDRIYVDSVGVRAGEIDPMAIEVMAEIGLDISGHRSKRIGDLLDSSFDLIVSLTPEAHHQAVELTRTSAAEVEYWPTFDPAAVESTRESRLAAYRQVRDGLEKNIRERFGVGEDGNDA